MITRHRPIYFEVKFWFFCSTISQINSTVRCLDSLYRVCVILPKGSMTHIRGPSEQVFTTYRGRGDIMSRNIPLPNVGVMLGQRRRRWANITPTLGQGRSSLLGKQRHIYVCLFKKLQQSLTTWITSFYGYESDKYCDLQQIRIEQIHSYQHVVFLWKWKGIFFAICIIITCSISILDPSF